MSDDIDIFGNPEAYELAIREELKRLGATQYDFGLISKELIQNNFIT